MDNRRTLLHLLLWKINGIIRELGCEAPQVPASRLHFMPDTGHGSLPNNTLWFGAAIALK